MESINECDLKPEPRTKRIPKKRQHNIKDLITNGDKVENGKVVEAIEEADVLGRMMQLCMELKSKEEEK